MALKKIIIFLTSISLIFSTGCWDKIEIDDRAFVLALAIDTPGTETSATDSSTMQDGMGKKVGEANEIKAVFYMPIPSKLSGGSVDTFSVEESVGTNMTMAIENLNMEFSRQLFFGVTKIILIGENALKNPVILRKLMDFIEREPDMGREALIAVVKGKTAGLTAIKPKFEKVFAAYMNGVLENSGRMFSGLSLPINEFLSNIRENKGNAVMPVAEIVGDRVSIKKLALVKDYKLLSYVDTKYIRPYSIITNELKDGEIIVPYKNDNVSLKISSSNTSVNLVPKGNKLEYKIGVKIEGDIDNYIFDESIGNEKSINDIKDKIKDSIKNELDKTTSYFQNDIGVDYLKLGDYTKKHNYKLYKKYENNWDQEFKKAKIEYDVQIFIRRLGGTDK